MTTPSTIVSRTLGTQYARAAPDDLSWAQERQFFQIQIANLNHSNESVQYAIANNVERTIESIRDAALAAAAMGLTLNPIAALVYFIPRREREFNAELDKSEADYKSKVPWVITASPSYRGLAWIATHHAGADDVAAEVVFKADHFVPRGPFHIPEHRPTIDNVQRKYEHAIGVYCGIRWPGGRERSEYMDRDTVLYIRSCSKMQNGMMWNPLKLWTEGWKKAVVRRACKLGIQGNPRMEAAESSLRATEGELLDVADVPRGTAPPDGGQPEPKPRSAARGMGGLSTKLDAAATKARLAEEAEKTAEKVVDPQAPEQLKEKPATTAAAAELGAERIVVPGARVEPQTELTPTTPAAIAAQLYGGTKVADWCAPSRHPSGSIEWWGDQVHAAKSRGELNMVRQQAIAAGVDKGDDAVAFAEIYRKHSQQLRLSANQQSQGSLV